MRLNAIKPVHYPYIIIICALLMGTVGCPGPVPSGVLKKDLGFPASTPLIDAAAKGDKKAVEDVLKDHPDVNAKNYDDGLMTALHYAAGKQDDWVDIIQTLMASGADPYAYTDDFRTPLHLAAYQGNTRVLKVFIDSGCDVNIEDFSQNNPLYYAVRNGQTACAELLIGSGSKINPRNTSAEESLVTAESYLVAARSYQLRVRKEKSKESYLAASNHYLKATEQYQELITTLNWQIAGEFLLYALANGASAYAAQQQAQMQAHQMAQMSALTSNTGHGVGYGSATYTTAIPSGDKSAKKRVLIKRLEYCKQLGNECKTTAESF